MYFGHLDFPPDVSTFSEFLFPGSDLEWAGESGVEFFAKVFGGVVCSPCSFAR